MSIRKAHVEEVQTQILTVQVQGDIIKTSPANTGHSLPHRLSPSFMESATSEFKMAAGLATVFTISWLKGREAGRAFL